jgi:excisionase family DNA binding protein
MTKKIIEIHEILPKDLTKEISANVVADMRFELQQFSKNFEAKSSLQFIDSKEVCKMLGITLPTLLDWRKRDIIPYYKIANKIRFLRSEIENALTKVIN